MSKHRRELTWAFVGIALVTAAYGVDFWLTGSLPSASSPLGHGTAIIGLTLMLLAQTLYSLRKQTRDVRWGPMVGWLQAHVVMGLVGPYMVLLHSAGKFNGVSADTSALLTVVVLASGIIGRYIYTSIPREIAGIDPERLAAAKKALAIWRKIHIPLTWTLFAAALVHVVGGVYYATLLR